MDSGSILIDSIVIDRANRIRRELKPEAVADLAESIRRKGLLHPVTLERYTNILIAGETRIAAHRALGFSHIDYRYLDELSEEDRLEIEIEENVKRTDLPWQDRCDALLRLHNMRKAENPAWRHEDTAEAIGYSVRTVQDQLRVAEKIASGDVRVSAAKDYSVAKNIVKRQDERKRADELSLILTPDAAERPDSPIVNADFVKWIETYDGPSFNFIHCDFPYGINADKFNQGAGASLGGYDDSAETYWKLVNTLVDNKEKLLGTSGHILFWFSMRYYTETLAIFREHFWVDPVPCIWFKSDNTGALPDPERGPRRVYETAFLASHGDRKILSAVANVFPAPVTRLGEHMSEKSQPMLEHFFRMIVDENTRMLDPTCGSGSALRAADACGANSVLGLELNAEFAENATRAWEKRNG